MGNLYVDGVKVGEPVAGGVLRYFVDDGNAELRPFDLLFNFSKGKV
jgi:hypothetical protein